MAEWDWLWQKNKHKIIEMKERNLLPPFLQTRNWLICDLAVPSLTHQWFLLSFATEVVKTPLALSSHLSPNHHVHWTSALLPPPPLTTCYSLFPQRCEVCCLIILVYALSRVRMHVRCIHESSCLCDIRCHGADWWSTLPIPLFQFAGVLPFLSLVLSVLLLART